MKKPHLLITGAWLVHAIAWFVPVIHGGVTLPRGLPGWEAFRMAACSILPCSDSGTRAWYFTALSATSAITTVLYILASPLIVRLGSRFTQRVSAWIAAAAFLVNAHWFILFGSDRWDLRIGYYLWWWSFALLAAGFFELARETEPTALAKSQSAGRV